MFNNSEFIIIQQIVLIYNIDVEVRIFNQTFQAVNKVTLHFAGRFCFDLNASVAGFFNESHQIHPNRQAVNFKYIVDPAAEPAGKGIATRLFRLKASISYLLFDYPIKLGLMHGRSQILGLDKCWTWGKYFV